MPREGKDKRDDGIDGMEFEEGSRDFPPLDECPTPFHQLTMKIIVWNCRGALKPNFQSHVRELTRNHNPAVLVVMETRIRGDRAKEITDYLPFGGAIHMDTIGYAGGIWLLWNLDRVEVV